MLHWSDFIFRFYSLHCLKTVNFFIHNYFQHCLSWCHFAEIMVLCKVEKAVIKNDFLERGCNAFKFCKEHLTKSWNRISVCRLLKRFNENNSMIRRADSGRQRTITTEENEELI